MLVSELTRPNRVKRTCDVNSAYFETLTEESSYWLGYLLADGCVAFRRGPDGDVRQTVLQLSSKDCEHLDKFKTAIGSTYAVCGPYRGCWQLAVPDYDLCLSLEKYGVVPAKSLTAEPPKLPAKFERHWARGVIDGDGCFNRYHRPSRAKKNNGRGRPSKDGQDITMLNVSGAFDVGLWFQNRFGGSLTTHANIWRWQITGEPAVAAIRWCYQRTDVSTRLNRKYANAVRLGIVTEDDHAGRHMEPGISQPQRPTSLSFG